MGGSVCCAASKPVHQSQKFGRGGQRLAAKTLETEQKWLDISRNKKMSLKYPASIAYLMKISNPAQAKILQDYLKEMKGVGYFDHALRVNKKTGNFETSDIVAAITVNRGNLSESFVDEMGVCARNEVPYYSRLDRFNKGKNWIRGFPVIKGKLQIDAIQGMEIDELITLKNLSHERTFWQNIQI
tara:strand:+ start:849 stop:1403 length:555 start_codon:yes stop_codon:yes gene_type:complete